MGRKAGCYTFYIIGIVVFLSCMLLYSVLHGMVYKNILNNQPTTGSEGRRYAETCVSPEKKFSTIPKIIHQVWNGEILPAEFIDNVKSLVRDNPHPEWKYYFWTREAGRKLLMEKYPYLLQRFNNETSTSNTMRADIMRAVIIHEFGGVYFDLDTMSVRPLASFVEKHECSLGQEPDEHLISPKITFLVTNAALLCRPKHPFFKHVLHQIATMRDDCVDPFHCTGPGMYTRIYKDIMKANGDTVKPPAVQSAHLFQDAYDTKQMNKALILSLCAEAVEKNLSFTKKVCQDWVERGSENRSLSALAYTYHTWFHVYGKKLEESPTNHILNIIPHAIIYGSNL